MSEENRRIEEWLGKFALFHHRSIAKLYRIKGRTRRVEDKEKVKWYHFPTQVIRKDIVRGLGELYDRALSFAKDESLALREREKWARLAAYIAQVINTIIDSYDTIQIEKTLDELKQFVKTTLEEGR